MIKRIKAVVFHPLFSGSAVMIIGSNLANFFAYIYHLIIGRLLGPALYGDLVALISVITMITAAFTFLGVVVSKFVSAAKNKNEVKKIFSWFSKGIFIFGMIIALLALAATPIISDFLHLSPKLVVIISPMLFLGLLAIVYKSFLQGLLKFKEFAIISNVEFLARMGFGVLLVYLGWQVFGAILGILLSMALVIIILWFSLRQYGGFKGEFNLKDGKSIVRYALPVLAFSLASTSFLTTDVILAKHFISQYDAGLYGALSNMGKIILYGTGPIGLVMFPMISQRHSKGLGYKQIFFLSFVLTLAAALGALFIYAVFPELAINLLYGKGFTEASKDILWFGVFSAVFSLASLISSFYLSLGRTRIVILSVFFALAQILGIVLFHDSLLTIIKVSLASASFLLLSLVIYFGYEEFIRKPAKTSVGRYSGLQSGELYTKKSSKS